MLYLSVWLFALVGMVWGSFEPLQVMCEVNGKMVPAIVDTGAEISVMSTSCARRCDLWNAIDTQHSGRAVGVGTSEIVGGIEGLGIRIGPLSFQNKISILQNSNYRCDFIIGLDILKRFNCDILLRERVIKMHVRGNEVRIPLVTQVGSQSTSTDLTGHFQSAVKHQQKKEAPTMTSSSTIGEGISSMHMRHPAYTNQLDEEEDEDFGEEEEYDRYMLERHLRQGQPVSTSPVATSTDTKAATHTATSPSRRKEYVVNRHCYDEWSSTTRIFSNSPLLRSSSGLQRNSNINPDVEKYSGHMSSRAQRPDATGRETSVNTSDAEDEDSDGYDDDCDFLGENENYEQFQERHRDRSISMAGV